MPDVLGREAVGQFNGLGFSDQTGTGRQQGKNRWRWRGRLAVRRRPVRIAVAGHHAGNVEQVLDREGQSGQPAGP
jgi:hypothetical protein